MAASSATVKPFGAADRAAMAAIARRARAEPATAIYVTVDDMLAADPALGPERPAVGTAAQLSDAELLTLAVLQALLRSYTTEARTRPRHASCATPTSN